MSNALLAVTELVANRLPAGIDAAYLDSFVDRYRASLREAIVVVEARYREMLVKESSSPGFEDPVEAWTKAKRTTANLAAMRLMADKAPADMTTMDRRIIASYSGWGGLELGPVADQFPTGFPVPETRGLIHEYYTPARVCSEVARVLTPYLWDLEEYGGIPALEPAAGIGRFIRAFNGPSPLEHIGWNIVEYSQVSGKILQTLYPGADVFVGPFERWVMDRGPELAGTLKLVVSNPPYGIRGPSRIEDSDHAYRVKDDGTNKKAYAYFMRRSLDLLAHGGIGVFLVPYGFLTGGNSRLRTLRERILRRHHLMAAYRMPSRLFPGALLVTDLLFFRARGGELPAVNANDLSILEGGYYALFPDHILGTEVGTSADEDDQQKKPRWGYQVEGTFTALPDLVERPLCRACLPEPFEVFKKSRRKAERGTVRRTVVEAESGLRPEVDQAVELGLRVDAFLSYRGNNVGRAKLMWYELKEALEAWVASFGNPRQHPDVKEQAASGVTGAERFLVAFERDGSLIPGLRTEPEVPVDMRVGCDDIPGIASALYRQHHTVTTFDVLAAHRDLGGTRGLDYVTGALRKAEWGHEGSAVFPPEVYYTGSLWPKIDQAQREADAGDEWAKEQVVRLDALITPVPFEEIGDVSPQQGWIPLETITAWIEEDKDSFPLWHVVESPVAVRLERVNGVVVIQGVPYSDLEADAEPVEGMSPSVSLLLGWINHDRALFRPRKGNMPNVDAQRIRMAEQWNMRFRSWCNARQGHALLVEKAYARHFLGFIEPEKSDAPLDIVRWRDIPGKTVLRPVQNRAVRRLMQNRGGLCSLDVGVGKTLTGAAYIAVARQEGWARRPVVLVPNAIPWKWYDDVICALPDFRIVVIGANRVTRKRKGMLKLTSVLDTPEQRAEKWTRFQAGEFDMAIVTYSVFSRTRVNDGPLLTYASHTEGIAREIALRKKNAKKRGGHGKEMSEREDAILKEGEAAWVAERMELPAGWRYDPGIAWDDIGVDLLIVDEAQNFKNLYLPEGREGNAVPNYMGNAGEGAKRAWQLDFRASTVRNLTGGSGIVLLSATPAKNSPLELYNLIQYVDHGVWQRMGIRDPEQFIDRYCKIKSEKTVDAKQKLIMRSAVVGFKNVQELRDVLFRYGEFVTAEQANIPLPEQKPNLIEIDMSEEQANIYEQLRQQAEDGEKAGEKGAILKMLARMAHVAIHPTLTESWSFKEATEAVEAGTLDPHSPKIDRCTEEIRKNRTCGHVVFVENVAIHAWLRAVLIEAGVKPDRIAILNAQAVPSSADKTRIAAEFNGSPEEDIDPKYDVVIANSVAYEGIDLQTRTCAIHHLDFTWEPATLHQRNGRGVRQGNTLETIGLNYYFARRSVDGMRFEKTNGKRTWLIDLLESEDREINNPAASISLSREEMLLMISNDPDKIEGLMAVIQEQKAAAVRQALFDDAIRVTRTANALFRRAASMASRNPDKAKRLRHEAEEYLTSLDAIDPDVWPWARRAAFCRDYEVWVTASGVPLREGDRLRFEPGPGSSSYATTHWYEVGKTALAKIALREAGTAKINMHEVTYAGFDDITPESFDPADWPANDIQNSTRASEYSLYRLRKQGPDSWPSKGWNRAADTWIETLWDLNGAKIVEGLRKKWDDGNKVYVPWIDDEGKLAIGDPPENYGSVLPPTRAGWVEFINLVKSGAVAKGSAPYAAAPWWWGNSIRSKDENI
jgi:superfamily II DNA/RNA helicase